jgi:nucleotide-binding universal stress UspA family protein
MNDTSRPCIVVGFDGSEVARAAIDYALRRAGKEGEIFIVHAFEPPPDWLGDPGYQRVLDEHETRGRGLLDALRLDIEPNAEAELHFELIGGPAAEAVGRVAEVRKADEIIVGSHGFGRLPAAVLGSVSHELLHLADRPVVVIPKRMVERQEQDAGS